MVYFFLPNNGQYRNKILTLKPDRRCHWSTVIFRQNSEKADITIVSHKAQRKRKIEDI
jgi:hypothetical protein